MLISKDVMETDCTMVCCCCIELMLLMLRRLLDGSAMIFQNGSLMAQGSQFSFVRRVLIQDFTDNGNY